MMNTGFLFKYIVSGATLGSLLFVATATVDLSKALAAEDLKWKGLEKQRGLPHRGQSSTSVLKKFGEPVSTKPAVGNPPISRWNYPDFAVYFEYNHVITTVAQDDKLPTKLDDIQ